MHALPMDATPIEKQSTAGICRGASAIFRRPVELRPDKNRRPARETAGVRRLATLMLVPLMIAACEGETYSDNAPAGVGPTSPDTMTSVVRVGASVLADTSIALIPQRRIGLIVNHTALVDTTHLIDVVAAAADKEVTALYGPEHGIRGEADAGEKIEDGRDVATGAPIFSLYGDTRKPTAAMLQNVDALVYDIQDVGSRFYTYISTLGLSMQAAAEQGIPFYVLDRPNPLGGEYVSGFVLEEGHESFVGQYPIPIAYGLTVGELARMIQGEGLLEGLEELDLTVIEMEGWTRGMLWPATGWPWNPPSPNIPDFETALVYAGDVFFEATSASEGRGTRTPFLVLGAPWADGEALADTLNARNLPGVRFEPAEFTPRSIEGMASRPKLQNTAVQGIRYEITDDSAFQSVEAGMHVLHAFYHQAEERGVDDFISRPEALARLSGTERLHDMLRDGASPEEIIDSWQEEVARFRDRRAAYLLY